MIVVTYNFYNVIVILGLFRGIVAPTVHAVAAACYFN